MRNTYVVGDIHASLNALKQVLERANFDNQEDKLIFLGDYCDGWSQSAEVVEYLIQLQKDSPHGHVFIKGNHDIWVADWLQVGLRDYIWTYNGGENTIDSYIKAGKNIDEEHREFFKNLLPYHLDDKNRLFVHAGIRGLPKIEDEVEGVLCWDRSFFKHLISDTNGLLVSPASKYEEVYIGHTPTINFSIKARYPEYKNDKQSKNGEITVPINRQNMWNMDTGCGWGGRLSMMNIDTKELFQSDETELLHPGEKGRKG